MSVPELVNKSKALEKGIRRDKLQLEKNERPDLSEKRLKALKSKENQYVILNKVLKTR